MSSYESALTGVRLWLAEHPNHPQRKLMLEVEQLLIEGISNPTPTEGEEK